VVVKSRQCGTKKGCGRLKTVTWDIIHENRERHVRGVAVRGVDHMTGEVGRLKFSPRGLSVQKGVVET